MKKLVAWMICLTMIFGMGYASSFSDASLDMSKMSLDDFAEKYTGERICFDGCVYEFAKSKIKLYPGNYGEELNDTIALTISTNDDGNSYDHLALKAGDNVRVTATVVGKSKSVVEKRTIIRLESATVIGRPTVSTPYIDMLLLMNSGYNSYERDHILDTLQDGTKSPDDVELDPVAVRDQYEAYCAEYGVSIFDVGSDDDSDSVESPDSVEEETEDISLYSILEKGSKGDDVKVLQQRLIDLYYLNDKADGSYGNKTKAAVEKFQKSVGLEVTGIADPLTQARLFADDAPQATMSVSCSSIIIGSMAKTTWNVEGQEFTLTGNQTKKISTAWGTYKFDAFGNYEKLD